MSRAVVVWRPRFVRASPRGCYYCGDRDRPHLLVRTDHRTGGEVPVTVCLACVGERPRCPSCGTPIMAPTVRGLCVACDGARASA